MKLIRPGFLWLLAVAAVCCFLCPPDAGFTAEGASAAGAERNRPAPLPTFTPNLHIMKIAPENTLPAIEKAYLLGYDYVELDARSTRDGVHPSFEEALISMEGRLKLYLDQPEPPRPELIRLLKAHGFYPDNLVVNGDRDQLEKFLSYEPEAPVMVKLESAGEVIELVTQYPSVTAFNTECETLTAEMVAEAHRHGVMIFTNALAVPANKERECMQRTIALGADAIRFDNMPLFFEVLEKLKREAATPPAAFDYLCPDAYDPENASDKVHIQCALASGEFAPLPEGPAPDQLKVAAYNLERGMYLDEQTLIFQRHPEFKDADVILISEADRGCSRVGYRDVAQDLARALKMNYVFGVEYVELPRHSDLPVNDNLTVCEHGNAILSRYPIGNARQIRHEKTVNWYLPPGPGRDQAEPRLGGALTLAADITVGSRSVRVYSVHLDSDIFREAVDSRTSEAADLAQDSAGVETPVIMGGDFNTINYTMDLLTGIRSDRAVKVLFKAGFQDAHSKLPATRRGTTGREYLVRGIIDLILVKNAEAVDSGICAPGICGHLSDHLPVWAMVKL